MSRSCRTETAVVAPIASLLTNSLPGNLNRPPKGRATRPHPNGRRASCDAKFGAVRSQSPTYHVKLRQVRYAETVRQSAAQVLHASAQALQTLYLS